MRARAVILQALAGVAEVSLVEEVAQGYSRVEGLDLTAEIMVVPEQAPQAVTLAPC